MNFDSALIVISAGTLALGKVLHLFDCCKVFKSENIIEAVFCEFSKACTCMMCITFTTISKRAIDLCKQPHLTVIHHSALVLPWNSIQTTYVFQLP